MGRIVRFAHLAVHTSVFLSVHLSVCLSVLYGLKNKKNIEKSKLV